MITDYLFFTGVNILLAWSVYVVLQTGCLSFAQGAFMALGAYGSGILTVKFGWPLLPAILVAALFTAITAAILGYPALRLRGIYLILVTLGTTFCIRIILENIDYIGGVAGFGGMIGAEFSSVLWALIIIGALLLWFSYSPLQRIFDAVREDERVAAAMGINITKTRLLGFAVGAAIAAVAGALYSHYMNFIRPENFDVTLSIYVVLYVVLGGINNMWGPVLGAAVMTLLPEYFRVLADWRPTVFGLAILIMLLFRPNGLLSFRTVTSRIKNKKLTTPQARSS